MPALWGLLPVLQVADARRSCDFYCRRLGFHKEWEQSFEQDFPPFISLYRDGCRIYLSEEATAARAGVVDLYTDDVDALWRELERRGATLAHGSTDELHLEDPDGNRLRVRRGAVAPM
ncbi:MAG TPA: glyoxalase superfamily protein [Gemmatimonadota bacterium]|nr:glyoxalase superfamily protein [Gemmatimonadota bacterium]